MKIAKVLGIIVVVVLVLGVAASCGQGDLQEQIDILKTQLADANTQVAELQQTLFEGFGWSLYAQGELCHKED